KKESVRRKLKSSPTDALWNKFKELRTRVKQLISNGRAHFFETLDVDIQNNPKRFWSLFKLNSRDSSVPRIVSMGASESDTASVRSASCPRDIAELFNDYFTSVLNKNDDLIDSTTLLSTTQCEPTTSKLNLSPDDVLTVYSGVPQGSILGTILFLLYVNDLPDAVENSKVACFADDTKIFRCVDSISDAALLQSNLTSCPSLSPIPNGNINVGKQLTHGSYAIFSCNAGYQQIGSSLARCIDGTWSEKLPKCLALCNPIRSIGGGWVYGMGNIEGDKLRFRCRTDYILDGEQFIKCTGNRRWNATKPTCRAPCRRFGVQPFRGGYIRRDGYRHNEEVTFGCRDPLVIDGQ
ncbi:Hypothetical predicted protein, partial [Paramuricea clavata]